MTEPLRVAVVRGASLMEQGVLQAPMIGVYRSKQVAITSIEQLVSHLRREVEIAAT